MPAAAQWPTSFDNESRSETFLLLRLFDKISIMISIME